MKYVFIILTIQCIVQLKASSIENFSTENITKCGEFTCYNKASCKSEGKRCQCGRGYMGETCQQDLDECVRGSPCYHRGYCENTFGNWRCHCLDGWQNGVLNHCEDKTSNDINVRKCITGWFGDLCENNCHNDSSCGPNQVCKKYGRGYICTCKHGFDNIKCITDVNKCKETPCRGLAACNNTSRLFTCMCPIGLQGPTCSDDVNECLRNPCKNSGACFNTNGSYHCSCTKGWMGINCDEDVDECESQPCNASLVCHNKPGTFSCDIPRIGDVPGIGTSVIIVASLGGFLFLLLLIILLLLLREKCKGKNGKRKKGTARLPEKQRNGTRKLVTPRVMPEGFVYHEDKPTVKRHVLDF